MKKFLPGQPLFFWLFPLCTPPTQNSLFSRRRQDGISRNDLAFDQPPLYTIPGFEDTLREFLPGGYLANHLLTERTR
ncbi:hypothetical protein [Lewinella sp. W8]|uniref:hypothetical protein n=1 Tax=Lewinella sp. W8 TaxID=2528208 RepID=UPI001067CF0E|nr:hypothetical protein [Lewinella sp. W8]MTB53021.1 hypothetical protein [Lewinella sp. W8]